MNSGDNIYFLQALTLPTGKLTLGNKKNPPMQHSEYSIKMEEFNIFCDNFHIFRISFISMVHTYLQIWQVSKLSNKKEKIYISI